MELQTKTVVETHNKTVFGFWVYLMSDALLFASLFATYAVLHTNTFGGPSGKDLFDLTSAINQTLILLVSSFVAGLATLAAYRNNKTWTLIWFTLAFLLGVAFLILELKEFARFVHEGNSWVRSAFLSAYFTLVGTHGVHISVGLLWIIVLCLQLLFSKLTPALLRRVTILSMYWHFLDVIWIFIFTFVYLMGAAT